MTQLQDAPPGDVTAHGRFSNATRYLCAAAHVDPSFMRQVLDEVLFPAHRGLAPSYGVDVAPVARHCLAAYRRILQRDGLIAVLMAAALFVAPGSVASGLLALYCFFLVARLFGGAVTGNGAAIVSALLVATVAGVIGFFGLKQAASDATSSGTLRLDENGQYVVDQGGGLPRATLFVVVLVAMVGVLAWHRIRVHSTVVNDLQRERFARAPVPEPPAWARDRLRYLDQMLDANVTVFSDAVPTKPFVGSGTVTKVWSLAIPLRPAPPGLAPSPLGSHRAGSPLGLSVRDPGEFSAFAVYERVRAAIAGLTTPDLPENEKLHGLTIRDRLYVSGMLPEGSPYLDPTTHLPVVRVPREQILQVAGRERGPERHYQVTRIASWEGEVEVSVFLYTAVQGSMLFLEFVATVLPSIRPEYHEIDSYERLNGGVYSRCVGAALLDLVRVLPMSPVHLVESAIRAVGRNNREQEERRSIAERLSFDYGARMSVRELGARRSSVYFQDLDAAQRVSLVERRVVASVVDTLEEYGLDTQEFGSRVMTIYNNSNVVMNSTVTGSAMSAGAGGLASVTQLASTVAQAARGGGGH